jgi:hypothetical protein
MPGSWPRSTARLIATLEDLFEQGVETLPELVNGLNAVRMHDQQGSGSRLRVCQIRFW